MSNEARIVLKADYNDKDLKRAMGDLQKLQAQSLSMGTKIQNVGRQIQGFGSKVQQVGSTLTKSVTLPIVGIGVAAIALQAEFEQSMNSLQVNAQASSGEMANLSKLALKMGADTVFSAGEAANAMLELSKGGLSVADIEAGALAATMNLAAAEGMDLARAAEIIVQSMNTFGISAGDTGTAVDVLAAGAVASTAGIEDLAGGLKFVGVTANQFGVSIETTVTALAAMNNAGIDATTAGTSLNRFFLGLTGTTNKSAKTIKSLGLEFFTANGTMRPMTEIIGQLATKLDGLSDKQRTQVLKDIFGVEGMRAANVLIQQGVSGFESLTTAVTKQGIAQELADARMSGTAGAMEQLKGSLESAAIVIGQTLAPHVQKLAGFFQGLVDKFQTLNPETKSMIIVVAGLAAAMGPLLIVVGMLIKALGAIVIAVGAITLPIAAVIAGIAAFVAILVLLWTKSEAFRKAVGDVWKFIQTLVSAAVNAIKQKLDENKEAIDSLKAGFQAIWNFIEKYVIPIFAALTKGALAGFFSILVNVIGGVIDFVGWLFKVTSSVTSSGNAFSKFGETISNAIGNAVKFVRELPGRIVGALAGAGTWLFETGKNMIQGLLNGAGSLLSTIGNFFLDKLPSWIKGPFQRALGISSPSRVFAQYGRDIIDGLVGAIEAGGPDVRQSMQKAFISWFRETRDNLKAELDAAKGIVRDFAKSVSDTVRSAIDFSAIAPEFDEQGNRVGMSFIDGLRQQADNAKIFAERVRTLIAMGLKPEALQQVLAAGVTAGTAIANELIAGGTDTIDTTNALVLSAQQAGDEVGQFAANNFYGAGVVTAQATYDGFRANFGRGGPARLALMKVMDNLAAAAARDVTINVAVTRSVNEVVTRVVQQVVAPPQGRVEGYGAEGAIVRRPTFALIGEAGPEALIPLNRTRGNGPVEGALGSNITINVNAGIGTNGAEVGRQIVDALKAYERRNGAVYVAA